jgi:hypothetical protein
LRTPSCSRLADFTTSEPPAALPHESTHDQSLPLFLQ